MLFYEFILPFSVFSSSDTLSYPKCVVLSSVLQSENRRYFMLDNHDPPHLEQRVTAKTEALNFTAGAAILDSVTHIPQFLAINVCFLPRKRFEKILYVWLRSKKGLLVTISGQMSDSQSANSPGFRVLDNLLRSSKNFSRPPFARCFQR